MRRAALALPLAASLITLLTVPAGADVTTPPHSISIDDVTKDEGNSGLTTFEFKATLSNPPSGNFTLKVDFATANGTATGGTSCGSGVDYVTTSGDVNFNRNNLTRPITVSVCGDTSAEADETFFVDLSNPEHDAVFTKSRGTGTIRNDDAAVVRSTSTTVVCPASTPANSPATCTVTVKDTTASGTPSPPQGTVDFEFTAQPAGSTATVAPDPCALTPDPSPATDDSSCTITFTANTLGSYTIKGSYVPAATSVHAASSGSDTIIVTARSTSTEVDCPASTPANTPATCTVTVTDTGTGTTSPPQGTVDFELTAQPAGSTPVVAPDPCTLSPDLTTVASDDSVCTVSFTSTMAGTYTIKGTYVPAATSVHAASNGSDTIEVTPGPPAIVTVDPPSATNEVDSEHCVTATVTDAFGNPNPGVTVLFSVTGSNVASGSGTTGADGTTGEFCYTGVLFGEDVIRATADTDEDGRADPGEPFGAATKTWLVPEPPLPCDVIVTEGGWIIAQNGDRGSFGGNAHDSPTGEPSGQQEYQDHGPVQPMNVHSTSIVAVVCSQDGKQASIFGFARIDGSVVDFVFRIDVQDLGEPGVGQDTYRIRLSNGYDSGGGAAGPLGPGNVLMGGNVQIHLL